MSDVSEMKHTENTGADKSTGTGISKQENPCWALQMTVRTTLGGHSPQEEPAKSVSDL